MSPWAICLTFMLCITKKMVFGAAVDKRTVINLGSLTLWHLMNGGDWSHWAVAAFHLIALVSAPFASGCVVSSPVAPGMT